MKKCPFCNEWNSDEALQCEKCHEWFELKTIRRKKTSVKSLKKEEGKKDSFKKKKKKKTLQEYLIPVTSIVLIVVIMVFIASHKPDVSKRDEKQKAKIESPGIEMIAPGSEMPPASKSDSTSNPGSFIRLYNNGVSMCFSGKCTDPEKVIEYLSEAINLRPDFANAYGARGNAYFDMKDYELALEDYNNAIRMKPGFAIFFNNRGNVFKELHRYEDAIADYNQAILLKPDNGEAYHNRGNVYFIQGNKELGCQDAYKACEYGKCILLEFAKNKKYCP